ncbi:MAG TPA: hypothetical protein PLB01_18025 [Thermoanaerobaculia bacterium]|nr:hypothetical protein [Thermoanaerobaculia bacterium]
MKTPHTLLRLLSAAAVAAVLALPAAAQVDLSRLVWIGDSEGAGYSANCLTKRVQVDSPGAVIARANGVDYQQPILSDWGTGGCLVLTSLAPSFGTCPGNAACPPPTTLGVPENLALPRPYNNLAIGGCAIHEMLYATTAADVASTGACKSTIDLVLRNSVLKIGSQVDQAIALNPSFVILANFGNDYLGAVLSGTTVDGVTVTPLAAFTADTNAALAKLSARQKNGIVTSVGNLTNFPFTTTLPPYVTSGGKVVIVNGAPIPLLGPKGCPTGVPACPIPSNTIVTLNAAGYLPLGFGIPCAVAPTLPKCNNPLPDSQSAAGPGVLLYADEVALLTQRIADYNAAIKAAAATYGYKFYDINDWLVRTKAGFDYGGATVSQAFLSGGIASYDGFHLTPIGYALLADDIIKFINANFPGANLKEPDLSTYLYAGGTAGGLSGPFTAPYAWAPMNDAEKATAIEQIFTLDFASDLAAMIGPRRASVTPGPSAPVQRHERADRTDPMP